MHDGKHDEEKIGRSVKRAQQLSAISEEGEGESAEECFILARHSLDGGVRGTRREREGEDSGSWDLHGPCSTPMPVSHSVESHAGVEMAMSLRGEER